ncbi:MAG: hypothetical protein R3Y45_08620 [Bacillota bacterium]
MKALVKSMDGLSKLFKIILALPVLDIVWVVYRLVKSISKKNTLGIILGIVLIIVGIPFLWIVDIITIVLFDKVIWID